MRLRPRKRHRKGQRQVNDEGEEKDNDKTVTNTKCNNKTVWILKANKDCDKDKHEDENDLKDENK